MARQTAVTRFVMQHLQTLILTVSSIMGLELGQLSNRLLKSLYYSLNTYSLPESLSLKLGYIFHTERIYDVSYFSRLIQFCKSYYNLTGKKAICTLMPYCNARVFLECANNGVDEKTYLNKTRQLAEVADLGYHGHFWTDADQIEDTNTEIKKTNFSLPAFNTQIERDLNWFSENQISHNGVYAAGWWFMNRAVLTSLLEQGFILDFSFSQSEWFQNPYSQVFMNENQIKAGEPFQITTKNKKILCIQNLIGCHQTPFPEDFIRNLLKLDFSEEQKSIVGVVNSHDYDLDKTNTLQCLEYLLKKEKVTFLGLEDFKKGPVTYAIKNIPL